MMVAEIKDNNMHTWPVIKTDLCPNFDDGMKANAAANVLKKF